MSKTAELRQKRGELWDKAKAFLNEHADENGMMNAEDTATYERMEKDIDSFGAAIDREERAERARKNDSVLGRIKNTAIASAEISQTSILKDNSRIFTIIKRAIDYLDMLSSGSWYAARCGKHFAPS